MCGKYDLIRFYLVTKHNYYSFIHDGVSDNSCPFAILNKVTKAEGDTGGKIKMAI